LLKRPANMQDLLYRDFPQNRIENRKVDAKSKVVPAASNVVDLKATKCMTSDIVRNRGKIMSLNFEDHDLLR